MHTRRITTLFAYVVGLAGLGIFGYSMTQQTQIQLQINHTMVEMNRDVAATTPIVEATAKSLSPLTGTTTALDDILKEEQHTVTDLATMNSHLRTIASEEQSVLTGMNLLASTTGDVSQELSTAASTTSAVLSASQTAASGATAETSNLQQLNSQTSQVKSQLHNLNTKLAALKLLP